MSDQNAKEHNVKDASVPGLISTLILNGSIAVVCLTLFSILRRRFRFTYDPRRMAVAGTGEGGDEEGSVPGLDHVVKGEEGHDRPVPPSLPETLFGWVPAVLNTPEETVLATVGLDAVMHLRFLRMGALFFGAASVLAVCVLIPVNATGKSGLKGLDKLTLGNVDDSTPDNYRLFAPALVVWIMTVLLFRYVYAAYREYYVQRANVLASHTPEAYSLAVNDIPEQSRSNEELAAFFSKRYGEAVYTANIAVSVPELDDAVADREGVVRKLEAAVAALEKDGERPMMRHSDACCGPCSFCSTTKVDAIAFHSNKLLELNEEIARLQGEEAPVTPSGFVSFTSLAAATGALQTLQTEDPLTWTLAKAPAPADVYWNNLEHDARARKIRFVVVSIAVAALVFAWSFPIALLAAMANFNQLANTIHALRPVVNYSPALTGIAQALIPTVLLAVFMSLLPAILMALSKAEGTSSKSALERAVLVKLFLFQLFNVLLVSTIAGSILPILNKLSESPLTIVSLLGDSIPKVSSYFINYVLLLALSGFPLELLRPVPLLLGNFKRTRALTAFQFRSSWAPGAFFYAGHGAQDLLVFLIGLIFLPIAPLVVPIVAIYFASGYVVFKHQLLYVYVNETQSHGQAWPVLASRILLGAVIGQFSAIGFFAIKGSPLGSLLIPLPILTLIFHKHLLSRFRNPTEFLPLGVAVDIDNGVPSISESTGEVVARPDPSLVVGDYAFLDDVYHQTSLDAPPIPPEVVGDEVAVEALLGHNDVVVEPLLHPVADAAGSTNGDAVDASATGGAGAGGAGAGAGAADEATPLLS